MDTDQRLKGLLALGFLAHLVATMVATTSPATEFELSIYRATPVTYWVGIWQALVVALVVGLYGRGRLRDGAVGLALLSGFSVVALPVLRGYYFQGAADSLTHLGYARQLASGAMQPTDLLYPGTHLVALFFDAAGGVELNLAMQYMVLLFVGVYLVFVPLVVRGIADGGVATVAGAFAALLFLPVNHIGTHLTPHPTSQTVLFLPLVVYLLFNYVTASRGHRLRFSAVGALLAVSLAAVVFLHPQEALDVIFVLVAIAGAQFAIRRWRSSHPMASHRPLYGHAMFVTGIFLLWAPRHAVVSQWVRRALVSLGGGASAVEVTSRAASLPEIGASLGELFLKLFFVATVFSLLAGLLLLGSVRGRFDDVFPDRNALVKYVAVALVPLFGLFVAVFAADFGDHYFRYLGVIMVFVTVLGAVALSTGLPHLLERGGNARTARRLALASFLVLLPLSMVVVHSSPYIFQPSSQVTEMEFTGYETALDARDESVEFLSVRDAGDRFVDAIVGPNVRGVGEFDPIDERAFAADLRAADEESRYVAISDRSLQRELVLYRGFRYPRAGFQRLESTPGIDKVQSNGDFRLYLIEPERSA